MAIVAGYAVTVTFEPPDQGILSSSIAIKDNVEGTRSP
jgi:hypothetical protein